MLESSIEYCQQMPEEVIEDYNHSSRNAITPGITSTELLQRNLEKMSIKQIQRHLSVIHESFLKELEILENRNKQVETGNVLIFSRRVKHESHSTC